MQDKGAHYKHCFEFHASNVQTRGHIINIALSFMQVMYYTSNKKVLKRWESTVIMETYTKSVLVLVKLKNSFPTNLSADCQ